MKKIDHTIVGRKIKQKRMQLGYTQEQMAEQCNISTSYLGHIERGSRNLSMETAVKITDCLNVSLDYLLLDAIDIKPEILTHIEPILRKHDKMQVDKFLKAVKILADNIDKL